MAGRHHSPPAGGSKMVAVYLILFIRLTVSLQPAGGKAVGMGLVTVYRINNIRYMAAMSIPTTI